MAVLLILGNGFDLHCGLNTRFSDYLCDLSKTQVGQSVYMSMGQNLVAFRDFHLTTGHSYPRPFCFSNDLSIWHVLFLGLRFREEYKSKSPNEPIELSEWKDIENLMQKTLKKDGQGPIEWGKICNLLEAWTIVSVNAYDSKGNDFERLLAIWILNNSRFPISAFELALSLEDKRIIFYTFLLDELHLFEKSFGAYVEKQVRDHLDYDKRAQELIRNLCGDNQEVIIESFNYTQPKVPCRSFRNLHGDVDNPIIGIDAAGIDFHDPRYHFTKAYRCLSLAIDRDDEPHDSYDVISKIVFYGHSLNAQDYTYFFNILKTKNIQDPANICKVYFAYSVPEGMTKGQIKKTLGDSVSNLINSFDQWMGQSPSTLEALDFQGKENFPFIN